MKKPNKKRILLVALTKIITTPETRKPRAPPISNLIFLLPSVLSSHEILLRLSDAARDLPLELLPVVPPLLGRVDVRRALVVGVGEHRDDRDEDRLDGVNGQPALAGLLVAPSVIA